MDITVKTKGVENVKSVIGHYDYLFSYFLLYSYCFYYFTIFSSMWQIALRYFYVQYKLQVIYLLIFHIPIILNIVSKFSLTIVLLVTFHCCVYQLREFILNLCLLVD